MKKWMNTITIYEKGDLAYNELLVSEMKETAIAYVLNDEVKLVSTYRALKHKCPEKAFGTNFWEKFGWTPVECKQRDSMSSPILFMLYDSDGTPKQATDSYEFPESKYEITTYDESGRRNIIDELKDENEIEYYIYKFASEYFEKEYKYHQNGLDIGELLSQENNMTIIDAKVRADRWTRITYRTVYDAAKYVADHNYGFTTMSMIEEHLYERAMEILTDGWLETDEYDKIINRGI